MDWRGRYHATEFGHADAPLAHNRWHRVAPREVEQRPVPLGSSGKQAKRHGKRPPHERDFVRLTDLTLSCAAGTTRRSRSGAAVAAHDVRRTESRTATGVTPSRWRRCRQLGCRAEAGPHQHQREVSRRRAPESEKPARSSPEARGPQRRLHMPSTKHRQAAQHNASGSERPFSPRRCRPRLPR